MTVTRARLAAGQPNAFLLSWAENELRDALRGFDRPFEIFGQGSRVNDTFIEPGSDIDLVLMLTGPGHDWVEFRDEILATLGQNHLVRMGRRCLNIDDPDSLFGEMVDILVATEYRQGVFFRDSEGRPIVNFPKQHRRNGDDKQGRTGGRFKEVVRTAKRRRRDVVDVPSYLLECLLYNVPDHVYRAPDAYRSALDWLHRCHREESAVFAALPCQNGINRLFGPGPDQWEPDEAGRIIDVLHSI
ncbi:hypothetical protein [Actinoplanes sp. HUAS TT8]|uniref:hypothetical protein n=1 Tax=Actinoplanes sp. HUAS TT8 TaxID=3447453 RepID=UPI003F51B144